MNRLEALRNNKNYFGLILDLPEADDRIEKFLDQVDERGFDDTELWNLDLAFLKFITPRLKAFKGKEANKVLENELAFIIKNFELRIADEEYNYNDDIVKEIHKAYKLFFKILPSLWY